MTNLVIAVRRDLAPHLKSLMGLWWFSQFDPVFEVSQAAKRSLQVAFPAQEKRLDALILCTNEIFMYLEEYLKLTPEHMSDKAVALDELKEMHQRNGALAEAIRIWKNNFDKEFEGVEERPICYSVIHTANHSLPCLACKHKFHSACIYKWFSTSHKSSCPLCQSPF
ncbi:hypothetical protein RGQ29_018753 [Quercus rubra]|uniref:E3 ubiquitin-protein ligase listerin n=1 Tax=Quercus rubra TaxID=3512 RepID=A0AAN7FQW7_QUERU|nr:hypothetical protein RGQ29_018753 [Quercus rubra]